MPIASRQWRQHRVTLGWRHRSTAELVARRYLTGPEVLLNTHTELSNLHLLGFLVASEDMSEDGTCCEDGTCVRRVRAVRTVRVCEDDTLCCEDGTRVCGRYVCV